MTEAQTRKAGEDLASRLSNCRRYLKSLKTVVVAFSGGVDSTFLLALAVDTLGSENVLAAVGVSPSLAERERRAARKLAGRIGAELVEIETNELGNEAYAANPPDRCYYCKAELFTRLSELARQRGFNAVVCGNNTDDAGDFRPGIRAGEDLAVVSPLMQAGLTKADIRIASKAMALETWNKPAMACLSSRVPYGQTVTAAKLSRIENAEYVLKDLGFEQCRVRDHGSIARIEVPQEHIDALAKLRDTVVASMKRVGYTYVCLDLAGFRSGAMNEALADGDG